MEWKKRLMELSNEFDLTDSEVSRILYTEFGVKVSDDSVRYYARRKGSKEKVRANLTTNGISKTLIISDFHCPFHREELIIDIILKHRDEVDEIIIAGDIIDCESISKFPVLHRRGLIVEMIETYNFLKRIDRLTPTIKKTLIYGNHEKRFEKYLADKGGELTSLHSNNILEEIIKGFTYYDYGKRKERIYPPLSSNFIVIDDWYYQHKDLIVAHPSSYSNIELRTFINAVKYFLQQGFVFNALLIGHTHKYGVATSFNKWGGELGCLCYEMDYSKSGKLSYTPQQYGYALVTFVNNEFDVNNSRIYKLNINSDSNTWTKEIEM